MMNKGLYRLVQWSKYKKKLKKITKIKLKSFIEAKEETKDLQNRERKRDRFTPRLFW